MSTPTHPLLDPLPHRAANEPRTPRGTAALTEAMVSRAATGSHKEGAPTYRPSKELVTSINVAIRTGLPLLLTGEPGTGKTQAGWYVAHEFGLGEAIVFSVRSVSTVRDLRYEFDSVAYLRAAYETREGGRSINRAGCVVPGPLWRAFASRTPVVLIIDEIDKAPRDFPNDLLHELDQFWFDVPELDGVSEDDVRAQFGTMLGDGTLTRGSGSWRVQPRDGLRPLVFITSNEERRLPPAFLRRCAYHHIRMTVGLLETAMAAWSERRRSDGATTAAHEAVAGASTDRHTDPRVAAFALIRQERERLQKPPTLSELLTWAGLLVTTGVDLSAVAGARPGELPYLSVLLKDRRDLEIVAGIAQTVGEFARAWRTNPEQTV